ncbi:MAG: rRNA maturation RNase YbeY [Xanthomonadales bacterium]|jgi:probable rRNA maturation factor|nr:rRNA maturation RNase YbeY [Xanthomonadales bacterium]
MIDLDLTVLRESDAPNLPADESLRDWAALAIGDAAGASLAIRLVDADESERMNREYRGKSRPTNVLSFPTDLPDEVLAELPARPLGDLVLCAPLVAAEAGEQGKPEMHHWAHLVVHGVLHLRGYDHETAVGAEVMEALEVELLARLGIPDPYRERD